ESVNKDPAVFVLIVDRDTNTTAIS
ncbi:MAG: hypothetical protein QG641_1315, partial [Candidatus Poribacteria bacterium]|nr:hypothetical protein [Candidatus Poribacteria bacterium]